MGVEERLKNAGFDAASRWIQACRVLVDDEKAALPSALHGAILATRKNPWVPHAFAGSVLAAAASRLSDEKDRQMIAAALLEAPFAGYFINTGRTLVGLRLAHDAGDFALCSDGFDDFEPLPFWDEALLRQRAACYAGAGHSLAPQAEADLELFLKNAEAEEALSSSPTPDTRQSPPPP
jgi:hypothetical protein